MWDAFQVGQFRVTDDSHRTTRRDTLLFSKALLICKLRSDGGINVKRMWKMDSFFLNTVAHEPLKFRLRLTENQKVSMVVHYCRCCLSSLQEAAELVAVGPHAGTHWKQSQETSQWILTFLSTFSVAIVILFIAAHQICSALFLSILYCPLMSGFMESTLLSSNLLHPTAVSHTSQPSS